MEDKIKIIKGYVPDPSIPVLSKYFSQWNVNLFISRNRITKNGDFRLLCKGIHQISVNGSLNPFRFLITLVHEIAHLVAFENFGLYIKPHGKEWKKCYQKLMFPLLNTKVFPIGLLFLLLKHFKNPMASTDGDFNLVIELDKFDFQKEKSYIFEFKEGTKFEIPNGKRFILGLRRRKRYECEEILTGKKYLFSAHAKVKKIEKDG